MVLPGWNWTGAKWWKFDFHNHTPASDDYGKGPDQSQYQSISAKEWLLNYMRAGIDCVAVTDHNSGAWIDLLKEALQELADEQHSDYRPLNLFPGVEITVSGNVHILAILAPDKGSSDIDSLLGAVRYRGTKGKSDNCTECSALEVIGEIANSKGIAIPAHVDQPNGLFTNFSGNTLVQVLDSPSIVAMEVVNLTTQKPSMYNEKKLAWAEIIGTDSHHPSGTGSQSYPGSRFTWVKMSEPSLDGLRLALIDGSLSLRRSDQYSDNPNAHGPLAIESITVENAKYLGRGRAYICHFNPWLNTIIGGRGTGKSTSLEFLRLALNRQKELPKTLVEEFAKYGQISTSRHDEGLLIDLTALTVCLRKDGGRFRVTYSPASGQHSIYEETEPDNWTESEGDIAQRFPIRIYSQKQIFELAKHPQALMQIVNDAPEVDFRSWKAEWDSLISRYLSLCAQAREVEAGLQEENVIKGQLQDVKRKLAVFEEADHTDILQVYQLRQNQAKSLESWEKGWESYPEEVKSLADHLDLPDIDLQHFAEDAEERRELTTAIEQMQSSVSAIKTEMQKLVERIEGVRLQWTTDKESLLVSQNIQRAKQEYNHLLEQLSAADAGDPSAYAQLVTQRQELEEKLQGFVEKRQLLAQHQQNASACLIEIRNHREQLTERRKSFLQQTLDGNPYVQINVISYGNKETLEEEFRELIDCENGRFERDIGKPDGEEGLLSSLYPSSDTPLLNKIEYIKSILIEVYEKGDRAAHEVRDKRFISNIQNLVPERLDRLRFWFPEDSLDVRFSLKDGANFRPVEQGSPGQKTAALLAFILSYGDEPLVLDQPEDDLDNHLIYDLIVTQLREIKQKRQVLIVTHNANIVVNGDAENVITLDVQSGQTRITTQGSLQEYSIRSEICRIMEGGHEAFNLRYKRINAGQ